MTDYKQLCAQLIELWDADCDIDKEINQLRLLLAQPEPEGPTVMEIIGLADEIEAAELGQVDLVRAALARWGNL